MKSSLLLAIVVLVFSSCAYLRNDIDFLRREVRVGENTFGYRVYVPKDRQPGVFVDEDTANGIAASVTLIFASDPKDAGEAARKVGIDIVGSQPAPVPVPVGTTKNMKIFG
jgi:uncharacterized protein YdbL (DUF1318 family)